MPMPAHMEITGNKQGAILGSCEMEGREETMLVYDMDHTIHIPRDPQSGLPSGKRIHGPLKVVKEFDKASPKIHQALVSGEKLESVIINWYRINPMGEEENYYRHTLETAIIVSARKYMPMAFISKNEPYRHMEEVLFTYDKIKWEWIVGGSVESEDSWKVPKV